MLASTTENLETHHNDSLIVSSPSKLNAQKSDWTAPEFDSQKSVAIAQDDAVLKRLRETIEALESENCTLVEELHNLRTRFDELRERAERDREAWNDREEILSENILVLQQEAEALLLENAKLKNPAICNSQFQNPESESESKSNQIIAVLESELKYERNTINCLLERIQSLENVGTRSEENMLAAENSALRQEIDGLTLYINKLIHQISDLNGEESQSMKNPQHIDVGTRKSSNWVSSLLKISGSAHESEIAPTPLSGPVVLSHKEMIELVAKKEYTEPINGFDSANGIRMKTKGGMISSIGKALGSWVSTASGNEGPEHVNVKSEDDDVPLAVMYDNTMTPPMIQIQMMDSENFGEYPQIQEMERVVPKVGYRQSRILENYRM